VKLGRVPVQKKKSKDAEKANRIREGDKGLVPRGEREGMRRVDWRKKRTSGKGKGYRHCLRG